MNDLTIDRVGNTAREVAADFWDAAVEDWVRNPTGQLTGDLLRWFCSYQGKGNGAVDLSCYLDPYVGDLRGVGGTSPRLVVLGLNPGIGYTPLQGRDGLWTARIAKSSYSRCFDRSPEEDAATWLEHHKGRSRYWLNLIRFARQWLADDDAGVRDILNFELYPWHSAKVTAPMKPPVDLVERYVFAPIRELPDAHVFALGMKYFDVCTDLGMRCLASYPPGSPELAAGNVSSWRLAFYNLGDGQVVTVSAQAGYAGPPNSRRTQILRDLRATVQQNL